MEFAIVNNYMGPVATKAMKGYSEEDVTCTVQDFKVKFCTDVMLMNVIFWVMTLHNLVGYYQCSRGTPYLIQNAENPTTRYHYLEDCK
jgi:hypothetical protein